jgi:tetrahydromethanopterin S-methyltransferase subunit D
MLSDAVPERFGLMLLCSLIGLFGGGIRAALRKDPQINPVRDVMTQAAASGFAAFLAAAIMLDRLDSQRQYLMLFVSGIVGWAGASVLDTAARLVTNWIDRYIQKLDNGDDPKPPASGGTNT